MKIGLIIEAFPKTIGGFDGGLSEAVDEVEQVTENRNKVSCDNKIVDFPVGDDVEIFLWMSCLIIL